MITETPDLDAAITRVLALRRCALCGRGVGVPPSVCLHCERAYVELPHTGWDRGVKRWLCVRTVERVRGTGTEQALWERLLEATYRGTWRGEGTARVLVPCSAPVEQLYPYAVQDAAAWAAAGYPTGFTL